MPFDTSEINSIIGTSVAVTFTTPFSTEMDF